MLNVMAGRLAEDPQVRQIPNGTYVCNTTVYVWPGKKGASPNSPDRDSIPVKIEAWGEQALDIAKYNKGETVQFVGKVIDIKYRPKGLDRDLTVMGFEVKRIDHNKSILTEFNEILSGYAYEKDQKDKQEEKNKGMDSKEPKQKQQQQQPTPKEAKAELTR
ncbi:single-stranded DNA-binding protein [Aminipila butyrica]|uniref:Single-stranded DNA-binding protein n=1 Tax=Aminipila butyrica TaxID=433296 RepID=A0A858BXD1_9FIRM|nr:single-stranded DNA-binding protein [Aminipila butyrica]QIB69768.1 single-stranded DNA-binding protein [Aminipila butyrica]